jgi:hypothetical protein
MRKILGAFSPGMITFVAMMYFLATSDIAPIKICLCVLALVQVALWYVDYRLGRK